MMKRKGSVLAITVGFSLVFTMLGLASIYMSGLQSETQEKQILSQQAFWLAEAGINRSLAASSVEPQPIPTSPLGNNGGVYSVILPHTPTPPINPWSWYDAAGNLLWTPPTTPINPWYDAAKNPCWQIISSGLVQGKRRSIQATVIRTQFRVDTVLKTDMGRKSGEGNSDLVGKVEYGANVDSELFKEIFGMTQSDMLNTYPYNSNPNNPPLDGIAYFSGKKLVLGENRSGILIVDGDLQIASNVVFKGIIWVNGSLTINGTGQTGGKVYGSVFVTGNVDISVAGDAQLLYDVKSIDDALKLVGQPVGSYKFSILDWQESNNHIL